MDAFFEIPLQPIAKETRGAARSISAQIKAAILDGRLAPGAKLPATRNAASVFGVSRNTAAKAYDILLGDGLVAPRRGSGTYVADLTPRAHLRGLMRGSTGIDARLNPFWSRQDVVGALGFWSEGSAAPSPRRGSPELDFRPGIVDPRLFPLDTFRRINSQELRKLEKRPPRYKGPQGNQGNYQLRSAITGQIALTRGIACKPEDVLITSGAQQAFDLLARTLVMPNETIVAIEDPGYPPLRVAFAAAGAKLVPIGVDEEGMIVEELPPGVGVICVCPSHQFPLGVAMSARRRRALVEFARHHRAVIVEDDYDGEFRHDGNPIDALRSSEAADVVFYVGTFSKCMLPSFRLGFIIASEWAMSSLTAAKNCLDWHCPVPIQLAVGEFIRGGHLRRHVRKLRGVYQMRRQAALAFLQGELAEWLVPVPSPYGLHVTAVARQPADLERVTKDLAGQRVHAHTLGRYYYGRRRLSGIVLGLGVVDVAQVRLGLTALNRRLRMRYRPP